MLPQIAGCGHFSSKVALQPSERTSIAITASTFELHEHTSVMFEAGRNFLIIVSARAIASLGFGLSILAIWLRWLLPLIPIPIPVLFSEATNFINGRRRPFPSELDMDTSRRAVSRLATKLDSPSASARHSLSKRPRRVYFADSPPSENTPLTESEAAFSETTFPITIMPIEPFVQTQFTPDSAPPTPGGATTLLTPLATPALPSTLTLDNDPDPETESSCQSGRPSSFIPKMKYTFNSKGKRLSLPSTLSASPETSTVAAKPKKKSTRPFTPPWLNPRTKPVVGSDTETNPVNSSNSEGPRSPTCRLTFHSRFSRPSSSGSGTSSPNSAHISLGSSLLGRKSPRRSSTPIPRTLPYEAPYFASPPLPFEDSQFGMRPARSSLDYPGSIGSSQDRKEDLL